MKHELLDKRDERIRGMFAQIAPRYDLLNHLLSLNIDKRWRRRTVRMLPFEGSSPVLDVCTGTGDLALDFANASGGRVEVIGSDFTPEMLEYAHRKGKGIPHVSFRDADAQDLPFESDRFQITTVAFGLRNVAEPERAIREMIRVTEPGGRVAILEFSRPRHWLMGRLYRGYFRYILPLVGQSVSRSRDSAYRYLPESVMRFPDGEDLARLLREHGLTEVTYEPFTLGVATLYVGRKAKS